MKMVTGGLFAVATSVSFAAASIAQRDQGLQVGTGYVMGAVAAILTIWGLIEECRGVPRGSKAGP